MSTLFPGSALALLCVFLSFGVFAQEKNSIELTRSAILSQRHEIMLNAMSLTPNELDSFKEVYRDWRRNVEALGDRKIKLVEQLMGGSESLTDAQTKALMDEWLDIQTEELSLKKTFVAKFRAILPEKKVARFFQLENKLDAALLYNLAGTVPMIEQ